MLKRKSTMEAPQSDAAPPMSSVEQYYYKPRRNPWPLVALVVAVIAVAWAYVAWNDDGGVVNDENVASKLDGAGNPALPAEGGLTSEDLAGCFTFQSGAAGPSNILDAASDPAAASLSEAGVFTKDIIDGYVDAIDGSNSSFDDRQLRTLLTDLRTTLVKIRDDALAAESAGEGAVGASRPDRADIWGPAMPEVVAALEKFGTEFEKRCGDGGVLVNVVPDV